MVLPLSGLRVVELTRGISGPACGLALADMGAEVIKIEQPSKDPYRDDGPLWKAAMFVAYNRNKKSLTLNLQTEIGKKALSDLLKTADILIENLPPGVVDSMGLSFKNVAQMNPKIVYCSIKSYLPGPSGEKDVDQTIVETQAAYPAFMGSEDTEGTLSVDCPPLKLGIPLAAMHAAEFADIWIAGALFSRMKTGKGQHIRVGEFECCVNTLAPVGVAMDKKWGKHAAKTYKTKDGEWVHGGNIANTDDRWKAFCDAFNVSEEDYKRTETRKQRNAVGRDEVRKIITEAVAKVTLEEARQKIIENNIIAGAVVTMKEVLENDQLKPKLIPLTVDPEVALTPDAKTVMNMMLPIRSDTYNPDATSHWTPAPRLGQDTATILKEMGYSADEINKLQKKNES